MEPLVVTITCTGSADAASRDGGPCHGAQLDVRGGDPAAGAFMSGFFPVMMFGLPAACLAMYHAAKPEKRKAVGGMLASLALTSFLTGVTEPIEFSFMFLAPALYAIHAVLTGVSMALLDVLHVKLGFTFSAGLFDYVLNFGKATRPLWLIPIGLVYAGLYYGLFRWAIARFDLKTPGREDDEVQPLQAVTTGGGRGADFVQALGGAGNLQSVDACTTRLRLIVADPRRTDTAELADLYLKQERVKDAADTLAAFAARRPLHAQAPLLQARVVEIYEKSGFDTLALHAGAAPDPTTGARAVPIHLTTSFVFESSEHAASLFNLERAGHVYSRISNPTNAVLEQRISALEGGIGADAGTAGPHLVTTLADGSVSVRATADIGSSGHALRIKKPRVLLQLGQRLGLHGGQKHARVNLAVEAAVDGAAGGGQVDG